MKAKTLLLAGLSALALTSCGMKSYNTTVSKDQFIQKLNEVASKNSLLVAEKPFSFVYKSEVEDEIVETFYKNGDKLSKETTVTKGKERLKFDASRSVYLLTGESKYEHETESSHVLEEADVKEMMQCDNNAYYQVHCKEELYQKFESKDPSAIVASRALKIAQKYFKVFFDWAEVADKYYIDDNVFTVELIQHEEGSSISKEGKDVYQLVINDNKIEFYSKQVFNLDEVNRKEKQKGKVSASIEKDDVSVRAADLSDYLEYDGI